MLCHEQYGFRAPKSNELSCQNAFRDIWKSFEQGKYTLVVFFDLAGACDSLDR